MNRNAICHTCTMLKCTKTAPVQIAAFVRASDARAFKTQIDDVSNNLRRKDVSVRKERTCHAATCVSCPAPVLGVMSATRLVAAQLRQPIIHRV